MAAGDEIVTIKDLLNGFSVSPFVSKFRGVQSTSFKDAVDTLSALVENTDPVVIFARHVVNSLLFFGAPVPHVSTIVPGDVGLWWSAQHVYIVIGLDHSLQMICTRTRMHDRFTLPNFSQQASMYAVKIILTWIEKL